MSRDPSFMATAPSADGPWSTPRLVPLADCNRTYCQHDMNLDGLILANGSFVGLVKVHGRPHGAQHTLSEIHRVFAADWADPTSYSQVPDNNGEDGNLFPSLTHGGLEDPDIYLDLNGRMHALFHAEPGTGEDDGLTVTTGVRSGAHAWSEDGGHTWTLTGIAFNSTVAFEDGSVTVFSRRERPHLVFGDPGRPHTPTHLSTSVQYGGQYGDATYTLIQPLAR